MKALDKDGVRQWLSTRSLPYDTYTRGVRPKWGSTAGVDIEIAVNTAVPEIRGLLWLFHVMPHEDASDWQAESLVIFQDCFLNEDPLYDRMVFLLRGGTTAETPTLSAAYAQCFREEERLERASFFMIGLLADWDTYFIPGHGVFFLFAHDRELHIVCESEETVAPQLECLRSEGARVRTSKAGRPFLLDRYWRVPP